MSDNGRQSFTDKVGAAVEPGFEKTTTEHMGDKFHGKARCEKSYTQKLGDALTGGPGHDTMTTNNNSSLVDKAKSALGMNHEPKRH
ncbi:hypothetical protein AURDEDRAFT_71105 [Auricularia subglabra TFB-10046 SS5]|uniref:Uncharacterized protein n=1 Tax=Auricularia subglabra (strain TFB-10046 / SS5) TaxID=717982 RepID=J0LIZ7_AURST|nr:hypothetical protein AURDEDRAFT_71105 [Auricularia subglabra TFB-10046 SS5]